MAARKKRKRHPGVVLLKPNEARRTGWCARYKDADTGKTKTVTLPEDSRRTEEARTAWAVNKSSELIARRAQLAGGATRIVGGALSTAIDAFYDAPGERKQSTRDLYKLATGLLLEWARARGISDSADITGTRLIDFRDYVLSQRKKGYVRGSKRGARRDGSQRQKPLTINWKLRAVKTVLNYMRERGQVRLSRDQITDALKPVKVPRDQPVFLRPGECQALLGAALRHDAETMVTREEESQLRQAARDRGVTREALAAAQRAGSTPRYEPIAPFVLCVLLTGMRFSEALGLRWASVDLHAVDPDGREVGEIRLKASETKTGHARTIGLDVSPQLLALLATLKLRVGKAAYVFGGAEPWAASRADAARRRLVGAVPASARKAEPKRKRAARVIDYGAPKSFTWQVLRSTCATYQCNAPALWGAAAAFVSAKRLGHSITVSEKHYAGLFAVSREARTLEAAMQIEDLAAEIVARAQARVST